MELFPNPFLSTGKIKESFEIFTYLARIGDQNSFICPLIQSIFVDHLVNVKHYPQGVTIHRGKPTRESVISVPKWENTECFQALWRGTPPHLGSTCHFSASFSPWLLTSALHPNHDALVTVGSRFQGTCDICNHLLKPDGAFSKSCEHLIGFFLSDLKQRFPEGTGKNNWHS